MNHINDIQRQLDNIAEEGKTNKAHIEGYNAAASVYREHEMDGAATLAEMKAKELEKSNEFLKVEWKRLKEQLASMPF